MKTLQIIILFALSLSVGSSRAEIIGYDGFDYRGSTFAGADGGVFWDYTNTSTRQHTVGVSDWDNASGFGGISIASGGLLYTADSGVIREYSGPGITEEGNAAITDSTAARKVYYRITMTKSSTASWCGVSSFDFGTERLFFGLFPDGTGKFSIYDQNTFTRLALSTVNVAAGQTYTLVAKLDYANDVVALYVEPNLNNAESFNTPVATASYTGSQWSTAIRVGSGGTGLVSWDDLTVATTWENLRTYEVTTPNATGTGSLSAQIAAAQTTGGRIIFHPQLGSVYAVDENNRLKRFRRETPGTIDYEVQITGLQPDEMIVGIDFRTVTNQLYALGAISADKGGTLAENRLYTINLVTGAATVVSGIFASLGPGVSFDYDQATDDFRVIHSSGLNLRVRPTGVVTSEISVPFASANITALAYRYNPIPGETENTLYGLSRYSREFFRVGGINGVPSPSTGTVTTLGPTPFFTSVIGDNFDIGDDGMALIAGSTYDLGFETKLYTIDLKDGKTKEIGMIGSGNFEIRGLAMSNSMISASAGFNFSGTGSVIVDGPATAPGITLLGTDTVGTVSVNNDANVALRNLAITKGRASYGGGLNHTDDSAGLHTGFLSLDRCAFYNNVAVILGGGLYNKYGNLRMRQCLFTNNTAPSVGYTEGGGGVMLEDLEYNPVAISHCTFTRNHSSNNAGGFRAIGFTDLTLNDSIIAGNTISAGTAPDAAIPTGATIRVNRTLFSDATGTSLFDGPNGNRIFAYYAKLLAPLDFYGGPTRSCPPLADNPAIGMAVGSVIKSDQRGFLINSTPDAGAAEFQGRSDLDRWWTADWDADGIPYGQELLINTDPFKANGATFTIKEMATGPGRYALVVGTLNSTFFKYAKCSVVAGYGPEYLYLPVGEMVPSGLSYALNGSAGYVWGNPTPGTNGLYFTIYPTTYNRFFRLAATLLP